MKLSTLKSQVREEVLNKTVEKLFLELKACKKENQSLKDEVKALKDKSFIPSNDFEQELMETLASMNNV